MSDAEQKIDYVAVRDTIGRAADKLTEIMARPEIELRISVNVDPVVSEWLDRVRERVDRDKRTMGAQLHVLQAGRALFYGGFDRGFAPPELADVAYPLALAILDEVPS